MPVTGKEHGVSYLDFHMQYVLNENLDVMMAEETDFFVNNTTKRCLFHTSYYKLPQATCQWICINFVECMTVIQSPYFSSFLQ